MTGWRFVLDEADRVAMEAARVASDERTRLALNKARRVTDVLPGREEDAYFEVTEILAEQERNVREVEEALERGDDPIRTMGREISREAAWAATTSIRRAWELGAFYDGQERLFDGTWLARVQIPIGKFEG